MRRPAAVVTLLILTGSLNASEEDEQRRLPEAGVLQQRCSIFRKPPLMG